MSELSGSNGASGRLDLSSFSMIIGGVCNDVEGVVLLKGVVIVM